jgi:hypothetical protein
LNPLDLFLRTSIDHTVYMAYSECLPTRLNPLAERTCFSQVFLFERACYFSQVRIRCSTTR